MTTLNKTLMTSLLEARYNSTLNRTCAKSRAGRLASRYPDAMRQGNVVRVLQSLYRRFVPYNNSLEHTAKISARLRLSSIFSGAQLTPR
jgi:hypothetical protein